VTRGDTGSEGAGDVEEETIDEPVQDGAGELRAEAVRAVESGEVDLTDTDRGGPSITNPPRDEA
jgi:hypothetical protein